MDPWTYSLWGLSWLVRSARARSAWRGHKSRAHKVKNLRRSQCTVRARSIHRRLPLHADDSKAGMQAGRPFWTAAVAHDVKMGWPTASLSTTLQASSSFNLHICTYMTPPLLPNGPSTHVWTIALTCRFDRVSFCGCCVLYKAMEGDGDIQSPLRERPIKANGRRERVQL